ncbi:MAG: flagellar hook protein FlgE [Firmicutes bacterium]|jgi:flagellar hook protein FlgE|nr:flagellar hook protein FlgE [Bacillota bacterium]
MIRAMSTAVTGLRSHQLKMDAIGNNIANVNTFGYKNTQVRFEDLFNQTMQGATASTLYRGGSNPMQIGMGVKVGANIVNQGQGPIKSTDRASDMAIEGNGFFVVSDGLNIFYTRDGSFGRDGAGNLVNVDGLHVLGWVGEAADISQSDLLTPIHIPLGEEMIANATTRALLTGNLDARLAIGGSTLVDHYVYDSQGRRYNVEYEFEKTGVNNWDYRMGVYNELEGNRGFLVTPLRYRVDDNVPPNYNLPNPIGIEFVDTGNPGETLQINVVGDNVQVVLATNSGGEVTSTYQEIMDAINSDPAASSLIRVGLAEIQYRQEIAAATGGVITLDNDGVQGSLEFSVGGNLLVGSSNILDLEFEPLGAAPMRVELGMADLTQLAGLSDVLVRDQDGYGAGEMISYHVAKDGVISGVYSNGILRDIGRIALTSFVNPEGLMKEGGNLYSISANSGDPRVGFAGEGGRGLIRSSALEMSNVDLAFEFTELITTSRGFQANTRVVTSSDEILIEILNMKR